MLGSNRKGIRKSPVAVFILYTCCRTADAYSGRYFGFETVLPPLKPFDTEGVKSHVRPLNVLYTNNPKLVTEWLYEHVGTSPDTNVLGFDVEVCTQNACICLCKLFES